MFSWIELETPEGLAPDARAFRASLGRFSTGVCLVTTRDAQGKAEGMTINSFTSVSLSPPLVLWSIRNDARSAGTFFASGHFNISVLGAAHKDLALHFAKPAEDKFERFTTAFKDAANGAPRLAKSVATYECSTYSLHREGDHTLLIGRVDRFDGDPLDPLLFHAGQIGSLADIAQALAGAPSAT